MYVNCSESCRCKSDRHSYTCTSHVPLTAAWLAQTNGKQHTLYQSSHVFAMGYWPFCLICMHLWTKEYLIADSTAITAIDVVIVTCDNFLASLTKLVSFWLRKSHLRPFCLANSLGIVPKVLFANKMMMSLCTIKFSELSIGLLRAKRMFFIWVLNLFNVFFREVLTFNVISHHFVGLHVTIAVLCHMLEFCLIRVLIK